MALSDACFEFFQSFEAAAAVLADAVHHYSAPDYPLKYGSEIDALRKACAAVRAASYDPEAGALVLKLAASVMVFHDTHPRDEIATTREKEMKRLIRLFQEELDEGDAISVPVVVSNVVAETKYTPAAATRMKELLSKLGTSAYDAAIKIITDIGSATVKKMLDI
jgi:Uncharacterized protein conserved in bacteria (DUF2321)